MVDVRCAIFTRSILRQCYLSAFIHHTTIYTIHRSKMNMFWNRVWFDIIPLYPVVASIIFLQQRFICNIIWRLHLFGFFFFNPFVTLTHRYATHLHMLYVNLQDIFPIRQKLCFGFFLFSCHFAASFKRNRTHMSTQCPQNMHSTTNYTTSSGYDAILWQ